MATFRDTEHLYRVMGALFDRINQEAEIAARLLEGDMVIRFNWRDPDGGVTVDLRQAPLTYVFGESDLKPDVEMTLSADTAHKFWLGQVSVPQAIATRRIIARGSVPKALKLLPAVQPTFAIYPQVLRELGEEGLLPAAKPAAAREAVPWWRRLLRRAAPAARPGLPKIDYDAISAHFIPIVEEVPSVEMRFRDQGLPTDEAALKVEMLRRMHLIRVFEERVSREFARGTVPAEAAVHLSIGQEACAVGACFALRADDYLTTTHRGHGHMLAKGADPKAMLAEILGKATGLCKGKGGSMHVTDAGVGAIGANGIVGASTLVAAGAALSARQRGTDQVALAFLGDGATAQGMFHEALNFAAVFDLPLILVIENNQYAEFTPLHGHSRVAQLSDRARAYGVPGVTVDGNDPWAVYQEVQAAVNRARRGAGPTLIEALTYRFHGHSEGETVQYRSDEEVAQWRGRDPIARWEKALVDAGLIAPEQGRALQDEAQKAMEAAASFAYDSPEPPASAVTEDVYAPEPAVLYRPQPAPEPVGPIREITYSDAVREALAEEMRRDPRVYLLGEDVRIGGYFAVTAGLVDEFPGPPARTGGPGRVIDTPISEYAIVGSSVGAAMTGMRPVAEIQLSDFLTCCMDPLINQAAKLRYMSGGQYQLPLVVRSPGGAGLGLAAQHSQSFEALLMGIPGLIIIAPGTPYDAKGLLKAAIRSNNPVLFFENKLLYLSTGPVPEEEYLVPIGVADVKREGSDITLVALGAAVPLALDVAEQVAAEGISVEVVDPRTLVPLDLATIVRSVVKTGRLMIAEPGHLTGGFGAEVAARVCAVALSALKAPIERVASLDVPVPYNRALEIAATLTAERLAEAVRRVVA